jgi:hypothetical protein
VPLAVVELVGVNASDDIRRRGRGEYQGAVTVSGSARSAVCKRDPDALDNCVVVEHGQVFFPACVCCGPPNLVDSHYLCNAQAVGTPGRAPSPDRSMVWVLFFAIVALCHLAAIHHGSETFHYVAIAHLQGNHTSRLGAFASRRTDDPRSFALEKPGRPYHFLCLIHVT